jgi:four helix bundle protein
MESRDPLRVLQAARLYGEHCVKIAHGLPRDAPAGLRRQLAKAAQSVSDLLAEGFGRGTAAERIHYCLMSKGELEESQNQLRRCVRLGLIHEKVFYKSWNLAVVIKRMEDGLISHLRGRACTEFCV